MSSMERSSQNNEVRITLRMPAKFADFLDRQADENFTSRNAQIVRAIREMMAATGKVSEATNPAAASSNNAALAGGASITR